MNEQQKRDLKDLREAAESRNQPQLQFLVKRLLQGMDYYVALSLPLERLHVYLPTFERDYPDETWVRQMIIAIGAFGTAPDDNIATLALEQQFQKPGAANYLKAVFDVTQAMQEKHTGEARIGFMASAIVNVIMAELVEAWYGTNPKAWSIVRENDYENKKAQLIAYTFWSDERTAARDTAAWLTIADSIEQKLTRLQKASPQ